VVRITGPDYWGRFTVLNWSAMVQRFKVATPVENVTDAHGILFQLVGDHGGFLERHGAEPRLQIVTGYPAKRGVANAAASSLDPLHEIPRNDTVLAAHRHEPVYLPKIGNRLGAVKDLKTPHDRGLHLPWQGWPQALR